MALPQDSIRALDTLRTRLSHLSTSINTLRTELEQQDPLPTWPRLQGQAATLGNNLQDLADALNSQRQLFSSMHAYPTPSFPGTTQEPILQGLLRKKLDPRAEAWIDESLKERSNGLLQKGSAEPEALSAEHMQEVWESAGPAINDILRPMMDRGHLVDEYTIQERRDGIQNVVTGIKQKMGLSFEDDDEEEDEEMEEDAPEETASLDLNGFNPEASVVRLDHLLKFMATGADMGQLGLGS